MTPDAPAELILASTSVYRRRLLERLQVAFRCMAPDVDEKPAPDESARELARRLAREKALAVSKRFPGAVVIGSDQAASLDGTQLAKPGTESRARAQLERCSGRTVVFETAVAVARGNAVLGLCCASTEVVFRDLSSREIAAYVALDRPLDCAGSFRWEGPGISLFEALRSDDPTALEGLPLISVARMLRDAGIAPGPRAPSAGTDGKRNG